MAKTELEVQMAQVHSLYHSAHKSENISTPTKPSLALISPTSISEQIQYKNLYQHHNHASISHPSSPEVVEPLSGMSTASFSQITSPMYSTKHLPRKSSDSIQEEKGNRIMSSPSTTEESNDMGSRREEPSQPPSSTQRLIEDARACHHEYNDTDPIPTGLEEKAPQILVRLQKVRL